MGTKRGLAPKVSNILSRARPGPVLDAFSGMCAIGQAVGLNRPVWNNDIQTFAATVAGALFTSRKGLRLTKEITNALHSHFTDNYSKLATRFSKRLRAEDEWQKKGTLSQVAGYLATSRYVGNCSKLNEERSELARNVGSHPYRLFTLTFANGFFGLRQAIQIDSARYAIDAALEQQEMDDDQARWLLIALGHATLRISTTTGHFAQFLKPNSTNLPAYIRQRRRSVWQAWLESAVDSKPLGTTSWRRQNRVYNREALTLLGFLATETRRPAVVYADPPYTDDQYSRYYHVWDSLVQYDYPEAAGEGRYRPDRFQTPFSPPRDVEWAFSELIRRCADLKADLVLSYPSNGLLHKGGHDLDALLRSHYSKVETVAEIAYNHSTMGASTGAALRAVTERIYLARN